MSSWSCQFIVRYSQSYQEKLRGLVGLLCIGVTCIEFARVAQVLTCTHPVSILGVCWLHRVLDLGRFVVVSMVFSHRGSGYLSRDQTLIESLMVQTCQCKRRILLLHYQIWWLVLVFRGHSSEEEFLVCWSGLSFWELPMYQVWGIIQTWIKLSLVPFIIGEF